MFAARRAAHDRSVGARRSVGRAPFCSKNQVPESSSHRIWIAQCPRDTRDFGGFRIALAHKVPKCAPAHELLKACPATARSRREPPAVWRGGFSCEPDMP
jgi:hypothetical protein